VSLSTQRLRTQLQWAPVSSAKSNAVNCSPALGAACALRPPSSVRIPGPLCGQDWLSCARMPLNSPAPSPTNPSQRQTPLPVLRAGLRTAEAAAHAGGGWVRASQEPPGAAAAAAAAAAGAAAATARGVNGGGAPRPLRLSWCRWRWAPAAQGKPALPRKAPVHAAGACCAAVCACTCVAVCAAVCTWLCMHVCLWLCVHVCLWLCMHVCLWLCVRVYARPRVRVCARLCVRVCAWL